MREIRLSGSEGGGFECNRFSLPLSNRIRHYILRSSASLPLDKVTDVLIEVVHHTLAAAEKSSPAQLSTESSAISDPGKDPQCFRHRAEGETFLLPSPFRGHSE